MDKRVLSTCSIQTPKGYPTKVYMNKVRIFVKLGLLLLTLLFQSLVVGEEIMNSRKEEGRRRKEISIMCQ